MKHFCENLQSKMVRGSRIHSDERLRRLLNNEEQNLRLQDYPHQQNPPHLGANQSIDESLNEYVANQIVDSD